MLVLLLRVADWDVLAFGCARMSLRKTLRNELARYGAAVDDFGRNSFCHWFVVALLGPG